MKPAAALMALALAACGDDPSALVPEERIEGDALPQPLSAAPGNAERGRLLFIEREGGHCILCHQVKGLEADFQGNVGPELSDVGARLSAGQIRLRIVDASRINPDIVMPSYHRVKDLRQVAPEFAGKPVLSAQEVEDLVSYLETLGG